MVRSTNFEAMRYSPESWQFLGNHWHNNTIHVSTHMCLILSGTVGAICTICFNYQEFCIFLTESILFGSCDCQNMQLLSALFSVLKGWSLYWRCCVFSEVWSGFYILFTWILDLRMLKFNKIVDNILWSVRFEIDLQFTYFIVEYMKN